MTIITVLAAVMMTAGSCSVKEDRADCPCWLKVFIDPFPRSGAVITAVDSEPVFTDMVEEENYVDCYEATVPRRVLALSCFRYYPTLSMNGGDIIIPKGSQADSLYAHHAEVDCRCERAEYHAALDKQFATVYMTVGQEKEFPYDIVIKGGVDGMDMYSFRPHEGAFEYCPKESAPAFFQFRLPRQKDGSLTLELYRKTDGVLLDTLPLGQYILDSGFDWEAESLEDIEILVDFSKMEPQIKVSEWKADKVYEITI